MMQNIVEIEPNW